MRAFELYDGQDYHKDLKILWVSHSKNPFHGMDKDLTQEEFISNVIEILQTTEVAIIEDENPQYSKSGPIGILRIRDNGWKYEPHVEFFPWATKRNMLRSVVGGLQWARHSRKIGCVEVICGEKQKNLFDHACEYGVLHYVGKMVNGSPDGDDYIYSVKGKKNVI
jgi:hypothetical protein